MSFPKERTAAAVPLVAATAPAVLSAALASSSNAKILASVQAPVADAPVVMADVSAETVLEAAVVSTAELSFLLHAPSANAAMPSDATLYPDPFLSIVLLPPSGSRKRPLHLWRRLSFSPVYQAKSVHITRYWLLRSRGADRGENAFVETGLFIEPRERGL